MRRRLVVVSAAVTAMVAVAFLAPLFVMVHDLARDRVINRAERDVEEVARVLTLLVPNRTLDEAVEVIGEVSFPTTTVSISTAEGTVLGPAPDDDEELWRAFAGTSFRATVTGGEAVYVPLELPETPTLVIRGFVSSEDLTAGVASSWLTLGGLGLLLTAIATLVADRLGRSIVRPVMSLSESTVALGEGDLSVRVDPDGPPEIREVGVQFNRLAERITALLQSERENAADLSHRLRTPLTAMRLDAEALPQGEAREKVLDDLAELERMVSFVIEEARRPIKTRDEMVDVLAVVRQRIAFWGALADEQGRTITSELPTSQMLVRLGPRDTEALIDAVLENAFAHTPDGTRIHIALEETATRAILRFEDDGPGFPDDQVLERGRSGGSGTGLGLDIVRRTAELVDGRVDIGDGRTLEGAAVVVTLPRVRSGSSVANQPPRGLPQSWPPIPGMGQAASSSSES
jgi:signal transduction histidine kinase